MVKVCVINGIQKIQAMSEADNLGVKELKINPALNHFAKITGF